MKKTLNLFTLSIPVFCLFSSNDLLSESARISMVAMQAPMMAATKNTVNNTKPEQVKQNTEVKQETLQKTTESKKTETNKKESSNENCREEYRKCMDDFCLLDESEGYRCACSENINKSKNIIKEIQDIQKEAEELYTTGVEKEKLGAKVKFFQFGQSDKAKKVNLLKWLSVYDGDSSDDGDVGEDVDIGDNLFSTANEYCESKLSNCKDKSEMEQTLYSRTVVQDCKTFQSYLNDQKKNALQNKQTAEKAVRKARLEMLDTTNKYNRGECFLAYRSCIADKGGCGSNFENCIDEGLLTRRANACENVLDQCMAVKNYVIQDFKDETSIILADAAKYADKNKRATCLAKVQMCLEDSCTISTNSACLSDVNVASGICPLIDECDSLVPGFKTVVNDKLGFLRVRFCQNDVDKCLQEKCGKTYSNPECLGKKPQEIVKLCPKNMFPSCKNENQFDIIVQSTLLQMDYQMVQGCLNHFNETLGKVCGMDMSCLPIDEKVLSLTEVPEEERGLIKLRQKVVENSKQAVAKFFEQFEKDKTISACQDSKQDPKKRLKGQVPLGDSVFNTAKLIAEVNMENRNLKQLEIKIAEISKKQDAEKAKELCLETYPVEPPIKDEDDNDPDKAKSYTRIKSVNFEPSLRNCHVCRTQRVCEIGGENRAQAALKAAGGGMAAGAAMGTQVSAGWGTAIGGAIGAVGGGIMGAMAGGKKSFCQEIESCEDINM